MSDLRSPETIGAATSKSAAQPSLLQLAFNGVYISDRPSKSKKAQKQDSAMSLWIIPFQWAGSAGGATAPIPKNTPFSWLWSTLEESIEKRRRFIRDAADIVGCLNSCRPENTLPAARSGSECADTKCTCLGGAPINGSSFQRCLACNRFHSYH
jgi:hypothetical protein